MESKDTTIAFIGHAVSLLSEATTVSQLKALKDETLTALGLCARKKADVAIISQIKALALKIERKMGTLLCAERTPPCSERAESCSEQALEQAPDLERNEEYRARQLASMPEPLFNRLRTGEITRTEALRLMQPDRGPDRPSNAPSVAMASTTTTRMRYEKVFKDDHGNTEKFEVEVVSDGIGVPGSVMANYKDLVKQLTDGNIVAKAHVEAQEAQERKRLLDLSYVLPKPVHPDLKKPDIW